MPPNQPRTPLHSFRCPDDEWTAAQAACAARGENHSEELRKANRKIANRRPPKNGSETT